MSLEDLFVRNREWSSKIKEESPDFFAELAEQQHPEYLWIGCSDSRVPANQIAGLAPGEVFVHRNVANLVVHTDLNLLTVMQYAIDVLKVRHVMVVGHYGCGGVRAALEGADNGMIDNWLRHIKDVIHAHSDELDAFEDADKKLERLCELNVIEQVHNVCCTTIVQNAWERGQPLSVHGCVYCLSDGVLRDLDCSIRSADQIAPSYRIHPS